MNKLKKIVKYLWYSRGICIARSVLTVFYAAVVVGDLYEFSQSLHDHVKQMVTAGIMAVALPLFIRSAKRMFDAKQREELFDKIHRLSLKIEEKLAKLGRKIIKWLGIDKILAYGKDERSFIFRERHRGEGHRHKLANTMIWAEQQSNSDKVRYIFTDYMIGKIHEGYRVRPSKTPDDMDADLAGTDEEHLLFESYSAARYSGGREEITDATVDTLNTLVPDKKKKRR